MVQNHMHVFLLISKLSGFFFFLNQIINYISKITVKKKEMQVLLESFKKVFKNTDTV